MGGVSRVGEIGIGMGGGREGGKEGGGDELSEVEVWEDLVHATISGARQRTILCDQSAVELLSFDGHFRLVSLLVLYDSLVCLIV